MDITCLQEFIPSQKAMGLVAELFFRSAVKGIDKENKVISFEGCWILSNDDYGKNSNRFAVFSCVNNDAMKDMLLFYSPVFFHLGKNGIKSYIVNHNDFNPSTPPSFYDVKKGKESKDPPFPYRVGRNARNIGEKWAEAVIEGMKMVKYEDQIGAICHNLTYYKVLKTDLKARFSSTHDIDGFVLKDNKIIPIEIKTKSPTPTGWFGIDVGRILSFCKLGMDGLYIVREIKPTGERKFVNWLCIDFKNIINNCEWNTVEGGRNSLANYATTTVGISKKCFKKMTIKDIINE